MISTIVVAALLCGVGQPLLSQDRNPSLSDCNRGVNPNDERKCDQLAIGQISKGSQLITLQNDWLLVRTKNVDGGPDSVSIIHVADSRRSDIDLAGLSLQCARSGLDVALITLSRLPRNISPYVVVNYGNQSKQFRATIGSSGESLVLEAGTAGVVALEWQNWSELYLEIAGLPATMRGVIPIVGLKEAMKTLSSNCPS